MHSGGTRQAEDAPFGKQRINFACYSCPIYPRPSPRGLCHLREDTAAFGGGDQIPILPGSIACASEGVDAAHE